MKFKPIAQVLLLAVVVLVFTSSRKPVRGIDYSQLEVKEIPVAWHHPIAQGIFDDRPDFFERGNQQFEREVRRMEQQNPDPVLTIQGDRLSWHRFIFRDGGFTIWMPLGTVSEETEVLETSNGTLKFKVLATNPPSSRFITAYSEELNTGQLQDRELLLSAVRDRLLSKASGFDLQGDQPLILDGRIGKEFTLQSEDETITFRVYLIEKRLYILGASQQSIGEISPQVITFFDSFQLL